MPTSQVLRSRIPLLVASLLAAGLAGCLSPLEPDTAGRTGLSAELSGREPGGPDLETGWRPRERIYPLQPGNSWHYQSSFTFQVFPIGEPPGEPDVFRFSVARRQLCWETIGNRRYLAEEFARTTDEGTGTAWLHVRDDETGLYEADIDPLTPPACDDAGGIGLGAPAPVHPAPALETDPELSRGLAGLPAAYRSAAARVQEKRAAIAAVIGTKGGARLHAEGELTRLSYPLHPGSSWVISEDPLFEARVEGLQVLQLPFGRVTAWRIRYTSDLFGPTDVVHVWYSRWGYLGLQAHLEGDAVDENGNVIGRVVGVDHERADEIDLVGRRFASY